MYAAIPQRWITRIEWFQLLVRADDLCFPMNKKNIENRREVFAGDDFENYFRFFWGEKSRIFSHDTIIFNIPNNNPYI